MLPVRDLQGSMVFGAQVGFSGLQFKVYRRSDFTASGSGCGGSLREFFQGYPQKDWLSRALGCRGSFRAPSRGHQGSSKTSLNPCLKWLQHGGSGMKRAP